MTNGDQSPRRRHERLHGSPAFALRFQRVQGVDDESREKRDEADQVERLFTGLHGNPPRSEGSQPRKPVVPDAGHSQPMTTA